MGQLRDLLIEYRESYSKIAIIEERLSNALLNLCPFYFEEEWTERQFAIYEKYPQWKKDKIIEIGLEFSKVNSMTRSTKYVIEYLELGHEPVNWSGIPHLRVGEKYQELKGN
mgnify:CR=1 FL=1